MLLSVPTFSFHSRTHFSIHGTKLITTNSLVNLAVCCMSCSPNLRVLAFGKITAGSDDIAVLCSSCWESRDGGGKRGSDAGTGTGGGGGEGRVSESK